MIRLLFFSLISILTITASLFAQTEPVSFYGIQTHFGQGRSDLDSLLDLVKRGGFGSIRDEVYWHDVETVKDSFVFKQSHDAYINGALQRGIKPLIILDYGNSLYGGTPRDSAARAAFARYCQAIVKRYSPLGVKHYEIWNEPNLCVPGFCPWDPAPNPSEYTELLKVAYRQIKSIDSTVFILGCATAPLDEPETTQKIPGVEFIRRVFALGGGNYMDGVSFHQYPLTRTAEQWVETEVGKIQAIVGTKPMWITEVGYPTNSGWPNVTENAQANVIARSYLLGRTIPQLQQISWYDLQNDCGDAANAECRYGILREDRSPKPAYLAIKTVATHVGMKPYLGMVKENGGYVLTFGAVEKKIFAAWHESGSAVQSMKTTSTVNSLYDRDGNRQWLIVPDSLVTLILQQAVQILVPESSAPRLKSFRITPERLALDSTQAYEIRISGQDSSDAPVVISPRAVSWRFEGSGGTMDSTGIFRATNSGMGKLIGLYQGFVDTVEIAVVSASGTYMVDDFSPQSMYDLSTLNVDSSRTRFSISTEQSTQGQSSGRLDYSYVYKSGIGTTMYRAYLSTKVLLPGRPDSLLIDVYGNGQQHRLEFRFIDAFGEYFIKSAADQPLNWNGTWKSVKIYMKGFGSALDYPIALDRITIFLVHANSVYDSTYSGLIFLDNIRTKYKDATAIPEMTLLPDGYSLKQNYPNPFNPMTTIRFSLEDGGFVDLKIFDIMGKEVETLIKGELQSGDHDIVWNAKSHPSSVYFYRLKTIHGSVTKKLVLEK